MFSQLLKQIKLNIHARKEKKIKQLPSFLSRLSTLLQEGYTFSDSIQMLLPFHVESVEYWRNLVNEKLRNGEQVVDILTCFSIPKHYLVAIKIAEESGGIALSLNNVANQIEFNEKMRHRIGKLLIYPVLLILFLFGIFIAFRTFFLPNIENIIDSRTEYQDNSSLWIPTLFLHLPDYFLFLIMITIGSVLLFMMYLKKQSVEEQSELFLKLPIINYFYRLQLTRMLARSLGSLIVGGLSLQQALKILKQLQLNHHLSLVSTKMERRIIYGDSLSSAVLVLSCFFPKFDEFIRHGEKSGYLGRELLLYCELLDQKLQTIVKTGVSIVQPLFFVVIATCIIAAYLSILLPMYNLIEII